MNNIVFISLLIILYTACIASFVYGTVEIKKRDEMIETLRIDISVLKNGKSVRI